MAPSDTGSRSEMAVATALTRRGHQVFVPLFGGHSRVDLVFEDGGQLFRVQCKTGRLLGDAVFFRTCSNTRNTPKPYTGEVDFLAVYCPELDQVYLVPIAEAPTRGGHLRLGTTKNGQARGVRWARDYVISG